MRTSGDSAATSRRPSAAQRGYGRRWQSARALYLRSHPLCVMCQAAGRVTAATVVDHVRPHRGDPALFWDTTNWQGLCETHHNAAKRREEHAGQALGCDADGMPLDAAHPWHNERAG